MLKNMEEVIKACEERPHGTEGDEYDSKVGSYHWDLGDMLIGASPLADDDWDVDGEVWHWNNTDRCLH